MIARVDAANEMRSAIGRCLLAVSLSSALAYVLAGFWSAWPLPLCVALLHLVLYGRPLAWRRGVLHLALERILAIAVLVGVA